MRNENQSDFEDERMHDMMFTELVNKINEIFDV